MTRFKRKFFFIRLFFSKNGYCDLNFLEEIGGSWRSGTRGKLWDWSWKITSIYQNRAVDQNSYLLGIYRLYQWSPESFSSWFHYVGITKSTYTYAYTIF